MNDLKARAVRKGRVIEVEVSGNLVDSCHTARIADIYPGGTIIYVTDQGIAEVFIEETVKQDAICTPVVIPWEDKVLIPDPWHDKVTIFVNHDPILKIDVEDNSKDAKR
jgi:hypothetical protein